MIKPHARASRCLFEIATWWDLGASQILPDLSVVLGGLCSFSPPPIPQSPPKSYQILLFLLGGPNAVVLNAVGRRTRK